jgi:hypothetical protein
MEISLHNQVAVVTGASSGIGSGIAKSLASAGATVIVNHSSEHSSDEAKAVLKEITDAGGNGITYQCDVSKEDQVIKMFQDVVSQFGTVDILINNAGVQKDAKFTEMTSISGMLSLVSILQVSFYVQEKPLKNFFAVVSILRVPLPVEKLFTSVPFTKSFLGQVTPIMLQAKAPSECSCRLWRRNMVQTKSCQFHLSRSNSDTHQQRCMEHSRSFKFFIRPDSL